MKLKIYTNTGAVQVAVSTFEALEAIAAKFERWEYIR